MEQTITSETSTKKKIRWVVIAIVVVIIIGLVVNAVGFYNHVVSLDENITTQQAQVENVYERRVDLVPQVAAVVKNYADYEGSTLSGIAALRSQSANLNTLSEMVANGEYKGADFSSLLASTLGGLKVTVEAYPELKANEQFSKLYVTLEGSENRIRTEIMNYNNMVIEYNLNVRKFPWGKLFSGIFGFEQKARITPLTEKNIKAVPDVNNLLK